MRNFYSIAVNTFKEAVREPIYCVLLLASVSLIALYPAFALFVFNDQLKMVVDSAMATSTFIGLLTAVLCASQTVSQEMRNGTVLLLLSKPVARASFVLGKIAGITASSLLFVWICNAMTVVALYATTDQFWWNSALLYSALGGIGLAAVIGLAANYWKDHSFSSALTMALAVIVTLLMLWCLLFGVHDPALNIQNLMMALTVIFFAVAAMSVLAVIFALRFDMVANLCICSVFFFIGLVSGHIFRPDSDSEIINFICKFFYAVLPNWQFFWLADALAGNRPIPPSYIGWAALYMALFITLGSIWAVTLFQPQEIAKDSRV